MVDLVEKVTRAQYHAVPRNKPFEKLSAFQREQAMAQARAAIAVCMEEAAKVAREAALYSGCPADFIADEIADAIRALSQGEQG